MTETSQLMTLAQGRAIEETLNKILNVLEGVGMEGTPGMIQVHNKIVEDMYSEPNGVLRRVSNQEDGRKKLIWMAAGFCSCASLFGAGLGVLLDILFRK